VGSVSIETRGLCAYWREGTVLIAARVDRVNIGSRGPYEKRHWKTVCIAARGGLRNSGARDPVRFSALGGRVNMGTEGPS